MIKSVRVSPVLLLLFTVSFFASTSQAVVIDIGDGSGNITASGNFADPFAHVGSRGAGGGVYLGNGVVLTANHVGAGTINLGGVNYNFLAGTAQRLHAPGDPGTLVDLKLFQIAGDPLLGGLTIGSVTAGTAVRLAGDGFDREADKTYWSVITVPGPNNDIWTETTQFLSNASGYKTLGTQSIRWGENTVQTGAGPVIGNTLTLATDFNSGESQAVSHDSGGGVFAFNGGQWELVGIMLAVGLFDNQPGGANSAVFGNATLFADLSQYSGQIDDYIIAIPTPGTLALISVGGMTLLIRRRRTASM